MKPQVPEMPQFDDEGTEMDLGACCHCKKVDGSVRNVLMLNKEASIPGTGWGCVVCDLPCNGAVSVMCDECMAKNHEPLEIVLGYPSDKQREPIRSTLKEFHHRSHTGLSGHC